jgi:hypothetical protein
MTVKVMGGQVFGLVSPFPFSIVVFELKVERLRARLDCLRTKGLQWTYLFLLQAANRLDTPREQL